MNGMSAYVIIFLLICLLLCSLIRKIKHRDQMHGALPPGSMGWPYIGETLQLYSQDPNVFFTNKQRRYGEIFKSNILGYPCVMLSSPEAAKFVLSNQAQLFKPAYPKSKETLIGPSALFFHQGEYHLRLRKLIQGSLSPETIRLLVPQIEALAVSALDSWAAAGDGGRLINTFNEMKKFSFDVGVLAIFGRIEGRHREELKKNYFLVDKGYNSFPTNIPGSSYKKALQARRRLSRILSEVIRARNERKSEENDLLGSLLNFKDEKGQGLTNEQIADNVIGVLFAAQDTTASVMTWIVKYLYDNPKLLASVKTEQKAIWDSNNGGSKPLTWTQTRNMPLAYKVVLESLRMSSIISFTFREAVTDVEYKGYVIPKGWKVLPLFRNIHHNPELYPDPQKFDPSRFEVAPKPNTFMPFGSGAHACPGNELAKLEILIMIHHLVTKFRWEVLGQKSGTQYSPFPIPLQGLPARFQKVSTGQSQKSKHVGITRHLM